MSTEKPNTNHNNRVAQARARIRHWQYRKFFTALSEASEETSMQIAQSSKQARPILFLTESRFIDHLENVIDHSIKDCSLSELETLTNFAIALAQNSGLTFQKISEIQRSTMNVGTKQSIEQRYSTFLEKICGNNFAYPCFAELIIAVKVSVQESVRDLAGPSGNLTQQIYVALYLAEVGMDKIESRIKNKIAATPKSMYLVSKKEYIINILTYIFLQRTRIADLDKLPKMLAELVKLDIQHLSNNRKLAAHYQIGFERGLSFDSSQSFSTVSLGRMDHSLPYTLSNVAFIPHNLNTSVKKRGKNSDVIQFHDKLIANRVAISELIADENKKQRANIKAMINVILAYHCGAKV